MNQRFFILLPLVIIFISLGIFLSLPSRNRTATFTSVSLSSSTPTIYPTHVPTPTMFGAPDGIGCRTLETQHFVVDKDGWISLSSNLLKLSFAYPAQKGEFSFIYHTCPDNPSDPSGNIYFWINGTSQVVGGISDNYSAGREKYYYDFYKIPDSSTAPALANFSTKYGTPARLVRAPYMGYEDDTRPVNHQEVLLEINLPFPPSLRLGGIAMYFEAGISTASAKRIIDSLNLIR